MGKDISKEDCHNCFSKGTMIVVLDYGDEILEQESVCSECNYSVLLKQEWRTMGENYLNDAEVKKFIEQHEGDA